MHFREFLDRIAFKRQPSGDHLIQGDAETVDVAPRVEFFAAELFRAHVGGAARNIHVFAPLRLVHCKPEVGQFDNAVFRDHDVVRLHVAVNQSGFIPGIVKRFGDLLGDMERFVDGDSALAAQTRPQILAVDISHRHVTETVVFAYGVSLHEVGVCELCRRAGFTEKILDAF